MKDAVLFEQRVRALTQKSLPLPAEGKTGERLLHLFQVGREDLSLAKIAEAHWDALAILAEAGYRPEPGSLYAVWASETSDSGVTLEQDRDGLSLNGQKMFCSGAGLVDRALITAQWNTQPVMVDVDLRNHNPKVFQTDTSSWVTRAFAATHTATVTFKRLRVANHAILGSESMLKHWYVDRAGFWQGALGPAACWGGGAAGLLDYALVHKRQDSHTQAHKGAMEANIWAIQSLLKRAGDEMDTFANDAQHAQLVALRVRHLIEQACTDTLRRFARAYGPFPLACDASISRRYQELDLFLRQHHAERDLESLGRLLGETPLAQ